MLWVLKQNIMGSSLRNKSFSRQAHHFADASSSERNRNPPVVTEDRLLTVSASHYNVLDSLSHDSKPARRPVWQPIQLTSPRQLFNLARKIQLSFRYIPASFPNQSIRNNANLILFPRGNMNTPKVIQHAIRHAITHILTCLKMTHTHQSRRPKRPIHQEIDLNFL